MEQATALYAGTWPPRTREVASSRALEAPPVGVGAAELVHAEGVLVSEAAAPLMAVLLPL